MPYTIRKQKCKQSDGDAGSYVLSYTDKSGKKHSNCHTSKKKAQGQIAAIEGQWEADEAGPEGEVMTERLLREMVRELLQENVNKIIDAYYRLVATEYPDGYVPVEKLEGDMGIELDVRDPKLTQSFDFYVDSETGEDMMVVLSNSPEASSSLKKSVEFEPSGSGANIARSGSAYEEKLVKDLESAGIKTAGVAGFTKAADVTILTPDGTPYGIEAKLSITADMGSAALSYDPDTGRLSVSNPDSPIGSEVQKRLKLIHSDLDFMRSIKAISDAGFLQTRKPAVDLDAWKKRTGYPTQPGRSYRLDNSDLIARHYQAKGETAEYIQIKGWGLYLMDSKNDPLNLSSLGVVPLTSSISLSVKVAQKGSSTPSPGKMSSLSMSAKAKAMSAGQQKSNFDLDNPKHLKILAKHLGY